MHFRILIIGAILIFLNSSLDAVGILQGSYHARASGMGGAVSAIGGNSLDLATNPANLSLQKKFRADIGGVVPKLYYNYRDAMVDPQSRYSYANNYSSSPTLALPYAGIAYRVSDRIVVGHALYVPGGGMGLVQKVFRNTPNGQSLDQWSGLNVPLTGNFNQIREDFLTRFYTVKFTNGMSYQWENLSIGLGLETAFGDQVINQSFYDASGMLKIPGKGFRYKSNFNYSFSGIAGITYKASNHWKIAYSYESRNRMYFNGKMSINVDNIHYYKQLDVSYFFELPERHTLGFAYFTKNLTLGLDITYLNFHTYDRSANQILPQRWFPTPIGGSNIVPGELLYKNVWNAKAGIEYRWKYLAFRTGYTFNTPAVTKRGILPLSMGSMLRKIFTLGLGIQFGNVGIDVAYNHLATARLTGSPLSEWSLERSVFSMSNIHLGQFRHRYKIQSDAFLFAISYSL